MKIGVPAFLTTVTAIGLICSNVYFLIKLYVRSSIVNFDGFETVMCLVLLLIFLVVFVMLAKRFKLVIIRNNKLILVFPLLFKRVDYNLLNISKVSWNIYGGGRSLEYLQMEVMFKSGEIICLSDQEYENFSQLQNEILSFFKIKDYLKKRNVRMLKEQAKGNMFNCVLGLLFFGFVCAVLTKSVLSGNLIIVLPLILVLLMFVRILFHTFRYLKILKS